MNFIVVPSTSRNYGFSIKAPADVKWAKGPGNTFGWYRRKRDAQHRCDELNRGKAVEQDKKECPTEEE